MWRCIRRRIVRRVREEKGWGWKGVRGGVGVCPAGLAWSDVPVGTDDAHQEVECSNAGICDRNTGVCACFTGFEGEACNRRGCPNDCSGHGKCYSMKQLAMLDEALPLSDVAAYEGEKVIQKLVLAK